MCFGLEPIVVASIIGATAAGGTALIEANAQKQTALPQLPDLPALPDPNAIKEQAKDDARKRQLAKSQTILTGGAGIIDEPDTKKQSILGG